MLRGLVVFLVLAAILGFFASRRYRKDKAVVALQVQELNDLNAQVEKLRSENQRLSEEVAKVQEENNRLAAINDALKKALEEAKLTGKVPKVLNLPYPPK